MAYKIYNISECSPDEHSLYFLDANVWIAVLKHTGSQALVGKEQQYVDFFEAVVAYHSLQPSLQKKLKHVPKFVMTSLLLSEVINAYMRKVAMVAFFSARGESAKNYDFKTYYRPISDYATRLRSIITDIQAFADFIVFEDDQFLAVDPMDLLSELSANPNQYDFNDLYFGRIARLQDWALVTNDGDSLFDEVPIITAKESLLRKR